MSVIRNQLAPFVAGALAVAAVGLSLSSWSASAAPGDVDTSFVPTSPCRLSDTRSSDRVGRVDTLGSGRTATFQAHGSNGRCTIPSEAVGLSMNITALNASAQTFLTIWPGGRQPTAASLNPSPGQPPTPNAVVVALSDSGSFQMFNNAGQVDVVIDVNGYYTRSSLRQLQERVAALEGSNVAPTPSGFSARITGYGPGFSITEVVGDTTNGLSVEADVRVDITCPNGTVETDRVFDVPPGQTRGWSVLCDGVFTSGATLTTVRV
ncbi:MAG: hypothetical protein ACE37B_19620 [Ilumatobacter sp.]|uniref:hypothetical protein n=1 Tax=Ilumatobacter sp. TaxID=1967498 RepID=UPI003918CCC1